MAKGAQMVVSDTNIDFAELVARQRFEEFRERQATLANYPKWTTRADTLSEVGVTEETVRKQAVDECLKLGIETIEWTISAEQKVARLRTKQSDMVVVREFFQNVLESVYKAESLIENIDTQSDGGKLQHLDRFLECLCELAAFVRSLDKTDLSPSLSVRERITAYETQQANAFQSLGTVRPSR
jgi:hypothetical protein